jgi:ADP-heptose:LPS heptosyltransferase
VAASEGRARLAPPTDLAALAAIFRESALVVTNDTGPMHLAVATGAPVVAVLLAKDGARWSHRGRFAGVAVSAEGGDEDVAKVVEAARALLG